MLGRCWGGVSGCRGGVREVCRGGVGEVLGRCVRGCRGCRGGVSEGVREVCQGVSGKCVGDGMMLKSVRMARGQQLAPLYHPDTLVNPDTCLGLIQ